MSAPPTREAVPESSDPPPELPPAPEPALPEPDLWEKEKFDVEAHVGAGTPEGALGLVFQYFVLPALSIGAGVGIGSAEPNGSIFHGSVIAQVRPARGKRNALVFGGAFSTGGYRRLSIDLAVDGGGDDTRTVSAHWAHFLQGDIGWEHRSDSGLIVRLSLGIAAMLNPGSLQCTTGFTASLGGPGPCDPFTGSSHDEILPTFDFALGQAF
ncbi:MAG TPA: hypothetical protein VH062_35765 [Polyangiaceae bacterium]|nr:hypothetical protein [Polyangiaceae bacterium]